MIIKENRTDSYIATVNLSDIQDMNLVKNIRKLVSEANRVKAFGPRSMYVKLQGRGSRMGNRRYNQSLPLSCATTADVYLYGR